MVTSARKIETLEDLRSYVHEILCGRDELEIGAFQMTERILLRSGRPCGMYFCLHGPRAVKLSAIWDSIGNAVLFYSSSGERFFKTQLMDRLEMEQAAA